MVRTHTVAAGETLSGLALRFYGEADLYPLIATASGIPDPGVIAVGQRLIFPDFVRHTVSLGRRCRMWPRGSTPMPPWRR